MQWYGLDNVRLRCQYEVRAANEEFYFLAKVSELGTAGHILLFDFAYWLVTVAFNSSLPWRNQQMLSGCKFYYT